MTRWLGLSLALTFFLAGCGGEDAPPRFEVDPNLVGPIYEDSLLGVRFQPPRDFEQADAEFMARVRRQMMRTPGADQRFFIIPRMIFALADSDARCFLSEFPNIGAARFDEEWKESYLQEAQMKAVGQTVNSSDVDPAGIPMLEVRIDGADTANRRYVFQGKDGRFLQIDYIIPSDQEDLLPRVASSISSLSLF